MERARRKEKNIKCQNGAVFHREQYNIWETRTCICQPVCFCVATLCSDIFLLHLTVLVQNTWNTLWHFHCGGFVNKTFPVLNIYFCGVFLNSYCILFYYICILFTTHKSWIKKIFRSHALLQDENAFGKAKCFNSKQFTLYTQRATKHNIIANNHWTGQPETEELNQCSRQCYLKWAASTKHRWDCRNIAFFICKNVLMIPMKHCRTFHRLQPYTGGRLWQSVLFQ